MLDAGRPEDQEAGTAGKGVGGKAGIKSVLFGSGSWPF